jgi:CNT family concentrative nucleoside transporter
VASDGDVLRLRPVDGREIAPMLRNLAFVILPTVIFFAALLSALYHLGIMQKVVQVFAWIMQKTMGTSGAESLSVAADIFVGQTEAPLVVRPYLPRMTKSELLTVMCGGFATIAGGVMAVYVKLLRPVVPDIAGHLMAASVMSAPAAMVISKMMFPQDETPETSGLVPVRMERSARNILEAVGDGATDGLKLAFNIGAMLIAMVALVAMINAGLDLVGTSLQELMGYALRPIAWSIGVPWEEADIVGMLLGEKIALTELIAYAHMSQLNGDASLSPRSAVIASYALCGFANFASIGVQIGGLGVLAPERKKDVSEVALKAMIAGAMATCMTAAIAGMLI